MYLHSSLWKGVKYLSVSGEYLVIYPAPEKV